MKRVIEKQILMNDMMNKKQ